MSPEGSIHITNIALNVRPQFRRTVDQIIFQTALGSFKKVVSVPVSPGHEHKEEFDPALKLSARDRLSVSVQYKSRWCGRRTLCITMEGSDVVTKAQDDGGKQTYFTFHKNIEVAVVTSRYPTASKGSRMAPSLSTTVYPKYNLLPPTIEDSQDAPSASAPVVQQHVPLPSIDDESSHGASLPTTEEIRKICPRFRLLVIGNTGVGKSTLIRKVFGVKEVDISESSRGKADINSEFVAAENGYFVLHDSVGLESGDSKNFTTIKTFISDRRQKEDLKDRLHAVWVCLTIPFAEGRLLEAGMEDFLRDREEILGDIPIVVVLTKLDLLDGSLSLTLRSEGAEFKTMAEAQPLLRPRRTKFLHQFCTVPLQRAAGGNIPTVAVSTRSGYGLEPTIPNLVKTSTSEIERYIKFGLSRSTMDDRPSIERNAPLYMAGMAQRASIEENVDLTIALGKQKYWTNLGACLRFSPDRVKEYLLVVHQDIIQVWNFNDPEMALQGDEFKGALLDTSNLGVDNVRDLGAVLGSVAPLISALAPLINELIGVVLALPIAGAIILTKFIHEAYKTSQTIVKRFMAYIVDLIYVMKILFILAPQGSIASQDVALAVEVYKRSTYRNRVHLEIREFSTALPMLPGTRDAVVEKIEVLIRRYSIADQDVSRLRGQIHLEKRVGEAPVGLRRS